MPKLKPFVTILIAAMVALGVSVASEGRDRASATPPAGSDGEAAKAEAPAAEAEEGLAVTSIKFHPNRILIDVENTGKEDCEVAIVMVDEAIGPYKIDGSKNMTPGEIRTLTVSYQWVKGDPYEFAVVDSEGSMAAAEAEAELGLAALESPGGEAG